MGSAVGSKGRCVPRGDAEGDFDEAWVRAYCGSLTGGGS